MIKITKHGKKGIDLRNEEVYQSSCEVCGCEFEYQLNDWTHTKDENGKYNKSFLTCPEKFCQHKNMA